jgi:transcriptional regulator with XRE-family HTH domain
MNLHVLERFSEPLEKAEVGGMREEISIAQSIGKILRDLRKRRELSLNDLAKLSGVSRSMLSQMETGRSIPSVLVLCKIASTFDVPVTVFLESEGGKRPTLLSAEETPLRISADGKCAWRSLMPGGQERKTEFYELTLRGGGIENVPPYPQGVRANLAVSKGSLVVVLDGRRHQLAEGDVLEFHARDAYALINSGNMEALIYLVLRHQ